MVDTAPAPASAAFNNSTNSGLQLGQNYGSMEASFYSDAIQQVTIAAGASVYMGEKQTVEEKLLDALVAGDPGDRHDIARAFPGTCEWIFECAAFQNWIQTSPPTTTPLYIRGIPGSGKTVLLKFLTKAIQTSLRSSANPQSPALTEDVILSPEVGTPGKTIAVACFCDDKNEHRKAQIWVLRTLLYKLLHQNRGLIKYALQHVQNLEDLRGASSGSTVEVDEFHSRDVLLRIIEDIVTDPDLEVLYFVVDGLDQCGHFISPILRIMSDLSTRISKKANELGRKFTFRCIISDRGSAIVSDKMLPEFTVNMPEGNQEDIGQVAERRVRRIQEYRKFPDRLREDITDQLKESSKGMFMWLSLVLDDLSTWEGVWTEARVKERLHSIPSDVEAFYSAILGRQSRDVVGRLRTLLMWVYFACRPLTLQELDVILTLQEGKEYTGGNASEEDTQALRHSIEGSWGTLFAVRSNAVYLSHQSVKDFLHHVFSEDGAKDYPRFGMSQSEAHRQMASSCLTYLRFDEIQRHQVPKPPVDKDWKIDELELAKTRHEYLAGYPFLQYSVMFLGDHLRESQIIEEGNVVGMKQFFEAESVPLQNWVKAYDLLKRWSHGKYSGFSTSTSLLFVAARLNLPWLADRATSWNLSNFSLPVAVAAPDTSGWSAIHIAADSEAVEMITWLLQNGAIVDATTLGLLHPGRTALHFAAAERSDAGPKMVKALLKAGARPNIFTRGGGNSALHYAIDGRSVETVNTLLAHSADPNATNSSGITPLHKAAAIPGLETLVEALLKGGADPNRKSSVGKGLAIRGLAAWRTSKTLIDTYHAINTAQTALHIAVKVKDAERTLEVLLKNGADANIRDSVGQTPLHVALVGMDREVMAKLLIDHGVDVNAKDEEHRTPLLLFLQTVGAIAHELRSQGQAELLLSDLDGQASWERTVELLLDAGADPQTECKNKVSPLSFAKMASMSWASEIIERRQKVVVKEPGVEAREIHEPEAVDMPQPESEPEKKGFLQSQASKYIPKKLKW
ncbi:ankyrin repeat domain-containing protein [Aspergillus homomorphus CBS 101889]|uniref:Putative skeletrophin n=1 Tax=Aspergillus homomorphus (strain CBS 101889) TaxID=1450537 RepID=A0A395HRE6_ASPHC|nr:putative skeletrophin [Aspergillus homomorphus CBS 101889]RAL10146.1 putative skeletrophin [Aspergillus homomorphus CBS 101889]